MTARQYFASPSWPPIIEMPAHRAPGTLCGAGSTMARKVSAVQLGISALIITLLAGGAALSWLPSGRAGWVNTSRSQQ